MSVKKRKRSATPSIVKWYRVWFLPERGLTTPLQAGEYCYQRLELIIHKRHPHRNAEKRRWVDFSEDDQGKLSTIYSLYSFGALSNIKLCTWKGYCVEWGLNGWVNGVFYHFTTVNGHISRCFSSSTEPRTQTTTKAVAGKRHSVAIEVQCTA
jgi:hypothetical protein